MERIIMILITRNNNLNSEVNIDLPASKSISNRLLLLQAFEESIQVHNPSTANDTKILQKALSQINSKTTNELIIDVEDAGTAFRFLLGYCALQNETCIIQGSKRLSERPIKPLVEALIQLGADIEYMDKIGFAPLKIRGRKMMGGLGGGLGGLLGGMGGGETQEFDNGYEETKDSLSKRLKKKKRHKMR